MFQRLYDLSRTLLERELWERINEGMLGRRPGGQKSMGGGGRP